MIIAELPNDEELRLNDLLSYEILDTQAEDDFDDLVELAGQICKCPISLITLLDENRQWFKAKIGLEQQETSRDVAFCAHSILQDNIMSVEDATKDVRFIDNPLVTGDLNIRFYAGAPILSRAGNKLGTICIIDHKPKQLSAEEARALKLLSNQVSKLLELRKKNIIIRKRAEEIIALKSKSISRVFKSQEQDKLHIASSLHEDLAQRIASSLIYLNLAVEYEEDRVPMLKTVEKQLNDIMTTMRNLTYEITPYAANFVPAADLVREFAEKISDTFSFKLRTVIEKGEAGTADNALTAIRVIEHWLKILEEKKGVSTVKITVKIKESFDLMIEDDRADMSIKDFENDVFESLVFDRVNSKNGTIDLSCTQPGNILKISLPLAIQAET